MKGEQIKHRLWKLAYSYHKKKRISKAKLHKDLDQLKSDLSESRKEG